MPVPTPSTERNTPVARSCLNQSNKLILTRHAYVEVAVGRQHDTIDAAFDEVFPGDAIGELDSGTSVGRAAGAELGDGLMDDRFTVTRSGWQHETAGAGIHHDGNAIALREHVGQHAHRGAHERKLVGRHHGARYIDQEHEVSRGGLFRGNVAALQSNQGEPVFGVPGANRQFRRD